MLKLEHISKLYRTTQVQTAALDDVSLEVLRGEFLAIMGPSGCGKSTLLNIIGLIDSPTVDVALAYGRVPGAQRRQRVAAALERVGLTHRAKHMPRQLSGGQQQRVAVARALVADPKVILADEPTGNLDTANGEAVMEMLTGVARAGTTIVMVTHSETHAARADRVVSMLDGRFVDATEL
jgi:putative ABC transport system ATP-binding protein